MDSQINNSDLIYEKDLLSLEDKNDNSLYKSPNEIEAPLSPVLNNSKHSIKHIVRQKSRIKLLNKLSQSTLASQDISTLQSEQDNANIITVNTVQKDLEQNKISKDDELEERMKRCMEIQRNKKFYYNLAISSSNSSENICSFQQPLVTEQTLLSANKINSLSKIKLSENASLFNDITEISHELPKLNLLAKENLNIGFETGSGKKINLSEKSIKRAAKLFDNIINLPDESANISYKNNVFTQHEDKENFNNSELNNTGKEEKIIFLSPKPIPEKKVSNKTVSQKSPYKNVHFGDISDSQMFLVAENAECLADFTNSQWTTPKTIENQNTLKNVEDCNEFTTQTDSLFSNITFCEDGSVTTRKIENISSDDEKTYGFDPEDISKSLKIAEIYNSQSISKIDVNVEEFSTQQIDLFFIDLTFGENGSLISRKEKIVAEHEQKCYGFSSEEIFKSLKIKRKLQYINQNFCQPSSSVFSETQSSEKYIKNDSRYSLRSRNKLNTPNSKTRKSLNKSRRSQSTNKSNSPIVSKTREIADFDTTPKNNILIKKSQTSLRKNVKKLVNKTSDVIYESNSYFSPIKTFKDEKYSQNITNSVEQSKFDIFNDAAQKSIKTFNDFNEFKDEKENLEVQNVLKFGKEQLMPESFQEDLSKNVELPGMSTNYETPRNVPFGFSLASGKKVKVSNESLNKVKNIFKDCDLQEDTIKNIESPKISTNYETPKTDSAFGFSTASGKKVKISEESINKVKNIFKDYDLEEDTNKNIESPKISTNYETPKNVSTFGFSTASGKKVKVSKESLDKVKNIFKDCDLEEDTNKNIESPKISTNYETPKNISTFGFSTASGKKVKISEESLNKVKNIFKDCDLEEDTHKNIESSKISTNFETPKNVSAFGFSTASGKRVKVSEESLNKVKNIFKDCDLEEGKHKNIESPKISTSFETPKNISTFGFSTASGKKVKVSNESLNKVKNIFKDCDLEEDTNKNIESPKISTNYETPKNVSTFGFSTASGKKVKVSEESLNKVKNIFKDCDLETDTNKNIESPKISTNYETPKNISTFGFSTASGKKVDVSKESLNQVKNIFKDCDLEEDTIKTSPFGFSTASEKNVEVSKQSLNKVKNFFTECDLEEDVRKNTESPKTSANFKTPKSSPVCGFSTASGNKVKVSKESLNKVRNLFNDCTPKNIESPKVSTNCETPKNVSNFGFSTASGKKVEVSKESLNKVQNLFNDCDLSENESSNMKSPKIVTNHLQTPKNVITFGFSTVSGNKVEVSKESLNKVKNIFNDCDLEEDAAKNIDDFKEVSVIETKKNVTEDDTIKTEEFVEASESKNHNFEYLSEKSEYIAEFSENSITCSPNKSVSSDVLSDNESTPILRNRNINCRKTKKRSLGISPCRQINISQNSLKKAKLIFDDFDSPTVNNNLPKYSISTSQNQKTTISSTQNKSLLSTPKIPTLKVSPVKSSCTENSQRSLPFLFQNETQGDVKIWRTNLQKEYEMCKLKMSVIETRICMLDKQQEIIKSGSSDHRRQRPGILFTKKSLKENRISFQKAVHNIRPAKTTNQICLNMGLSPPLLEITSENAQKLHFYVSWWKNDNRTYPAVIRTEDEAIVIPNQENYVGVSEIELAFLAMPGIDPNLVPKKWVLNHFRWIVWKLASMERSYPNVFKNCLSIENVVDQLKYRYDREIDRAQRPALRKILECDDIAAKRMVLCVATIYKMENKYEIELTDGWYSIRTILDPPLNSLVERNVIKIGMKLVTHGADLLNCEGCCPLETPPNVRLQIHYNSTRRAPWHTRLGFQPDPGPLCIHLRSIHGSGGPVGLSAGYIARIYPIVYLERQETRLVWRNSRAEQRCANRWEAERAQRLEALQMKLQQELEMEWEKQRCGKRMEKGKNLKEVCCGETLFYMLENSKDPDSLKEMMSSTQCTALENYQNQLNITRQNELSSRLRQKLEKEKIQSRNVSCVLKLLLVDIQSPFHSKILNIWKPTESHLRDLKERLVIKIYHILAKNNNTLSSVSRTKFDINFDINTDKFENIDRNVVSISQTMNLGFKSQFGEFDTVGMVVALDVQQTAQLLWLADEHHRYLLIKIRDNPDNCCLLDGLTAGKIIAATNLSYCKSHKKNAEATANIYSVLSSYPQQEYLQDFMKNYIENLPENVDEYLEECKNEISNISSDLNKCSSINLVKLKTETGNENFEEMLCGTNTNLSKSDSLTLSDEEMALMSSQLF